MARAVAGRGRDDHVAKRTRYANEVVAALKAAGLRVETDLRNEKIGYKVREHSLAKVPVILAVGMRDAEGAQRLHPPPGLAGSEASCRWTRPWRR